MLEMLSVVVFAVALSLDGFGVGIAYGMRRIRIPIGSLLVISLASSTAIGFSMLCGRLVAAYVSAKTAEFIGAAILILVGLWILWQTRRDQKEKAVSADGAPVAGQPAGTGKNPPEKHPGELPAGIGDTGRTILRLKIRSLGLVIQILREPTAADFDRSGFISAREALLLGLALAMDALGAGFGAAMSGFRPVLTPVVVGVVKFIMVGLGDFSGRRYAAAWLGDRAAVFPGWVLIFLGVLRVIKI